MTPQDFFVRIRRREYAISHSYGMIQRDLGESDVVEFQYRPQYKKRAKGAYAANAQRRKNKQKQHK